MRTSDCAYNPVASEVGFNNSYGLDESSKRYLRMVVSISESPGRESQVLTSMSFIRPSTSTGSSPTYCSLPRTATTDCPGELSCTTTSNPRCSKASSAGTTVLPAATILL